MKQIAVNTLDNGLARTVTTLVKQGGEINAMGGVKHFPMLAILVIKEQTNKDNYPPRKASA